MLFAVSFHDVGPSARSWPPLAAIAHRREHLVEFGMDTILK